MRLIDADALRNKMYHEAFEKDSDMQKWDGGCWIRYKMFENAIDDAPTIEPQQWIPVSERLPEEKINENTSDFEYVLCTTTFGDVRPYKFGQTIGWSEPHFWHWNSMMDKYVVAWCELPEPYEVE